MIVVMGTIALAAGDIDRLQPDMAKQMAATQAEDGCEQYVFSRDVTDPDTLLISERWRDGEALAAHGKTAHMAEFNKAIGGATIKKISVKAYDVAGVRVLMGE
jgi:quinol monooxygenase YgiN